MNPACCKEPLDPAEHFAGSGRLTPEAPVMLWLQCPKCLKLHTMEQPLSVEQPALFEVES